MSDRSVEALPPAETDPPAPIDETTSPVDPDDDHPGRRGLRGRIGSIGWRYTLVVFAVEVAFFSITAGDRFLTTTNLILTAQNVAVLTVVACGSTFVLITAGVDLSVGSVAILGEVLAAKTINAHAGGVLSLAFTHDGKLVSCGRDGQVKLWGPDGSALKTFERFDDIALKATFTHDGARVVAGDYTGAIRVWNLADGKRAGDLTANPPTVAQQLAALDARVAALQAAADSPISRVDRVTMSGGTLR